MKTFIKETIIIIAFIMICVLIKSASTSLYHNSHVIPAITEETPECVICETTFSSKEFDNQTSQISQLENIDVVGKQILDKNAKEYGRKVGIWCLFVLLGLRYGRKIFRWLAH